MTPAERRSRPRRVSGALKEACDLMVWGGTDGLALEWDQAAERAGLRTRTMRLALLKPHVRQYLTEQRRNYCAAVSSQNISRAVQIRDQDENRMASVQAMKFIEEVATERAANAPGRVSMPGVVIIVNAKRDPRLIPDQGLIEIDPKDDV